jgi:hypothetical protein
MFSALPWAHWIWRVAVLAALLWNGWELHQRTRPLADSTSLQVAALSQQVNDLQSGMDDVNDALDDVQDALDRIESAVEDDDGQDEDTISKQASLLPAPPHHTHRRSGPFAKTSLRPRHTAVSTRAGAARCG